MEFARKIKTERLKLNLTKERLAEDVDVSVKTILKWEKGESKPVSLTTFIKLKNVFHVSLDYLMKTSDVPHDEIQEYTVLGRKICSVLGVDTVSDLFKKYAICEKETQLLFPKKQAVDFIKKADEQCNYLILQNDWKDSVESDKLQQEIRLFLFNWYKFNKANAVLSRSNSKSRMLMELEKIFCSEDVVELLGEQANYPQKSVLFLRDLLINRIVSDYDLNRYQEVMHQKYNAVEDDTQKSNVHWGELCYPLCIYK